jgi:hypothetical protein
MNVLTTALSGLSVQERQAALDELVAKGTPPAI